jgi:glycosyltransferase involved in cell wall biosynthesis
VRYFVDISTVHTASWGPPRGVTRVEYNVAREAVLLGAKLVRFDETLQAFVAAELPVNFGRSHNEVTILLAETATVRAPLMRRRGIARARALGKSLANGVAAGPDPEVDAARSELAWLLAYNYEFLPAAERFELASHAHALEPQALCHKFNYWITVERGKHASLSASRPHEPIELGRGDKLLSLGAIWKQDYIDSLERLTSRGVNVLALIHDMIPITHPGFLPSEELERFKVYLARILKSDIVLTTTSRASQQEIVKYSREILGFARDIAVTPLASSAAAGRAAASVKILDAGLPDMPFVFMAGSFEPRKNQKFLLDIWRIVVARLADAPALVFAGGLAKASYLQEIQREARDLDRVLFFFNVDDEELAWFYENCLFTVFPSEAEGWGLPVTEALDHGKYCLASDNMCLREAGEGLVFHAALQDRQIWIDELYMLLSDPLALKERATRVRENHRARSWADVTRAMMAL